MFNIYRKSLKNKLLTLFIGIGILPFITLLAYTIFLSETKILNKIVIEQSQRADSVIGLINNHLNAMNKEVKFLSSLGLMDDILADDIDKRIAILLSKKVEDLGLDATLSVISENEIIIASSNKELISQTFSLQNIHPKQETYIKGQTLFIFSKIFASFDSNKSLGVLMMQYDLNNLDIYLTHNNSVHSYIINTKNMFSVGEKVNSNIYFAQNNSTTINEEHVIVSKQLFGFLNEWNIVYAVDKDVALEFLYDFINFMLYISIIILFFIIYISIKNAKEIVKPIEKLKDTTDKITNTQNYSTYLETTSEDEIAALTHSFNTMIQTTSEALNNLEEENKLRLKRFTQLIEVFNTIIQTKNENECIDTSINEIKKLTNQENLLFHKNSDIVSNKESTNIYVTDFENDEKIYFGSIELGIEKFEDINEKNFYNSIATMITLQLDRIRLIERTMSASRAKSAFISNMSHELRTPLNAIIGFSQFMITYEKLNDDQVDTVSNIETSAQYLLGMINEILDISKIEAGKMEAFIKEVDIESIITNSYNMLTPLAEDKGLKFNLINNNFETQLYKTDPKMFQQILVNLISNSIKFTEHGEVTITYTCNNGNIILKVKDSGIGISDEDIKLLFNDFTQVENVMQKKHKGTGLGLSLSKKMAEILQGTVTLESEGLGLGSTAIFQIKIL